MKKLLFLLIIICLTPCLVFGNTLYVQSIKAPIKESPIFSSKVLSTAQRGDKLVSDKSQGNWFSVEFNGRKGWVPSILVSDMPPMKKIISVVAKSKINLATEARKRPSSYTTAAAARGLSEDRSRLGKTRYSANFTDVKKIESDNIDENMISEFIKEGGLK